MLATNLFKCCDLCDIVFVMGLKEIRQQWEKLLADEGMPSILPREKLGIRFGLGLGVKSEKEEALEDDGGHSIFCPINLGHGMGGQVDQTNDRPVEDRVIGRRE